MSAPASTAAPDPAPPGVPAPPAAHEGAQGLSGFRALLRPLADPDVCAHLAALRASQPVWPPPVVRAGPTVRSPRRTRGNGGVRHGLAVVERCAGPRADVPCLAVRRGVVVCPRCRRATPVVEPRTGPRLPVCDCWPALCAHWPARVAPR